MSKESTGPLTYDRRAHPALMKLLKGGAPLAALAQRARRETLLDLAFRGSKVTLYLGLTNLLSIQVNKRSQSKLHLHTGRTADEEAKKNLTPDHANALNPFHKAWMPLESLTKNWPAIDEYVTNVQQTIKGRWTAWEGAVQSVLELTGEVAVIDREVTMSHPDAATKQAIRDEITGPYKAALKTKTSSDAQWWNPPSSLGSELDLMCVDRKGRLLLIELKPARATSGITWAPAQVGVYRDYFRRWVEQNPEAAYSTITGMLQQKRDIGLLPDAPKARPWKLKDPLDVVAVVGVGGDIKSIEALPRLVQVQKRLLERGVVDDNLEVWTFGSVVRRKWNDLASITPDKETSEMAS